MKSLQFLGTLFIAFLTLTNVAMANIEIKLYENEKNEIILEFDNQKHILIKDELKSLLRPKNSIVKDELMAIANLVYLSHNGQLENISSTLSNLSEIYSIDNNYFLKEQALAICTEKVNQSCIDDLIKDERLKESFHWKKFLNAKSYPEAHNTILKAMDEIPHSDKLKSAAQLIGLKIAQSVVTEYLNVHTQNHVFFKMRLTEKEEEYSFFDTAKELLFNTVNFVRVAYTDWDMEMIEEWENQQYQLNLILHDINLLIKQIQESQTSLENHLRKSLNLQSDFVQSTYLQKITNDALANWGEINHINQAILPGLYELGFMPSVEFVRVKVEDIIIKEVNIFNVALFVYGPTLIKSLGKSPAGMLLLERLKLDNVLLLMNQLPKPIDSIALFLTMKTAEGKSLRWGYSLFMASEALRENDSINNEKSIQKHFK